MAIMDFILSMNPLVVILGFSFLVSLISVLAYKFFTNQVEMKQLKEDMKMHQQEMKDHRNDQKKMLEIQKKAMEKNMKYMQHSFRPMIFTFLPIILLFGWLHANFAYDPIAPQSMFNVTVFASGPYNFR